MYRLFYLLKQTALTLFAVLLICSLVLAGCVNWPLSEAPGPASSGPLLLDNVSIVDVETGQIHPHQAVWIDKGRISKITASDSSETENSAAVRTEFMADGRLKVYAAGRFLMPGLTDMHTHSLQLSPQLHHPLWIAAGVTAVRDLSGCMLEPDSFQACTVDRKLWQQELHAGQRTSPNYWLHSSYQLNGGPEVPVDYPAFFKLQSATDAKTLVAHYQAQGTDFIKVYEQLNVQQYQWLVAAAKEAGMALAGHQPWLVPFQQMLDANQGSVEHGRVFIFECADAIKAYKQQPLSQSFQPEQWRELLQSQNPELCQQLMQQMALSNTWWSPTLLTLQLGAKAGDTEFRQDSRLKFVPYLLQLLWQGDADSMLKRSYDTNGLNVHIELLALAQQQLKQAQQAGVKILAGTDTPDSFVFAGSGLHDELALYQQAGLTPLEVIQTATINPAIFAGIAAQTGSIAVGKTADLILLDHNPLLDLASMREPEAVVLAGHWYPKILLLQLEGFAEDQSNSIRLNLNLLWDALMSAPMRQQFAD
jgi:imidazolonepropionase-like amidohydrolase